MLLQIQTFFNTSLRCIYNIKWLNEIRNEDLWERAGQEPAAEQILRRTLDWIGHTIRKPEACATRQALPGTGRVRGREADLITDGGETRRQR
jgi:hypothetical protein